MSDVLGCPIVQPESLGDVLKVIDYCGRVHGGDDWLQTALLGLLALLLPVAVCIVGFTLARRWQA